MNTIFLTIVLIAFGAAAWRELGHVPQDGVASPMAVLSQDLVAASGSAVELAIGLVGTMTLFLGLMKVAEAGGMLTIIARLIRPLLARLFPDVPPDHPAMGAMVLNLSANVLGLGNAATPFGIRAMQELDKLNTRPGVATDAMALFLAINTSSVTLLPTGVIALRAAAGSADPAAILPTTLFATICSTSVAIAAAFLLRRLAPLPPADPATATIERPWLHETGTPPAAPGSYPLWVSVLALGFVLGLVPLTVVYGRAIAPWVIPLLIAGFLSFGALRRVRVYETFVEGAKEGFQVALRIIPYLVAILVAVAMFRASGALDVLVGALGPVTARFGLPAEALPMALLRPLSGSGAYGVLASLINDPAIGPDSYTGLLVSTLQGSSETTFYVLAVYFGAVQIRRVRHTLATGLIADVAAVVAAVAICSWLF
ncbi:MAG: spore maturation protein [Gammaproteobacteria bacterium]|nr:spore maturation protein [Gammaproteobacteria bacterium]